MILVTLLYIGLIFGNSATPGVYSSAESNWVTDLLNRVMEQIGFSFIQFSEGFIRKAAHFTEYSILGVLLTLSLLKYPCFQGKRRWWLIPVGFCVACIDECIQLFTPGRDGNLMDVLLDTIGVAFGVAICALIAYGKEKRRHE